MSDSNKDINAELLEAVKKGEFYKVKSLISEGADVNAVKDLHTSLYWAAKNDHFNIVEVLLDNGAYVDRGDYSRDRDVLTLLQTKEAEYCKSSLHLAARLGNLGAVKDLLEKGADVNAENDYRRTPLDLTTDEEIKTLLQNTVELLKAAENSNEEVKHLISEGAIVNAKNDCVLQ